MGIDNQDDSSGGGAAGNNSGPNGSSAHDSNTEVTGRMGRRKHGACRRNRSSGGERNAGPRPASRRHVAQRIRDRYARREA